MHEIRLCEILMLKQHQSYHCCSPALRVGNLAGCFLSLSRSWCDPSSSCPLHMISLRRGLWKRMMELGSQDSFPSCYRRFPASKTSVQRSSEAGTAEGRCCFCPAYPGGTSWAGQEEKGLQVSLATESSLEVTGGSKGWSAQAAWEQRNAILLRKSNEEFQDCLRRLPLPNSPK